MPVEAEHRLNKTRWLLGFSLVLLVAVLIQTVVTVRALGIRPESIRWLMLALAWSGALTGLGTLFVRNWQPAGQSFFERLFKGYNRGANVRVIVSILVVLFAAATPALSLFNWPYPYNHFIGTYLFRVLVFWLAAFSGALMLKVRQPKRAFEIHLAAVVIVYAVIYRFVGFLQGFHFTPFSLDWSEASHYYYSSLYFSERFYGIQLPWPVLNPARYLLQAVPFLFGRLPIWLHRIWQIALWISSQTLIGWMLARRLYLQNRLRRHVFLVAAWAILFILQGPIWFYLGIVVIIVLLGTDAQRPWKTLVAVVLASAWAGLSRVNWLPFPAVLALVLYMLETRRGARSVRSYLTPPVLWGLAGISSGLFVQWIYARLSGNPADYFTTSLNSDLLWYRLFPNSTYFLGILPGAILLLVPPVLLMITHLRGRWNHLDLLTRWVLAGVLTVFLAGGLVVSVKIGGGDNLHNLDGFIVMLLVVTSYIYTHPDLPGRRLHPAVAVLAVGVPVAFILTVVNPLHVLDRNDVAAEFSTMAGLVERHVSAEEEALFISERHLVTFDRIREIRFAAGYEKVMLMEMAMAGNRDYLDRFREDLSAHRFALIVTDQVSYNLQPRSRAFSEENNIWDENIDYWLECHYKVIATLETAGVHILKPRSIPACPARQSIK